MPKTATTPYPAYQASGWVGGSWSGDYDTGAGGQDWTGLPTLDYPGLYQLQGYASSRGEALAMYSYTHGGAPPAQGGESFARQATLWTAGFVGAFSLVGFGAAAFSGLGAAGAGLGTRIGTAIAVSATASISEAIVTEAFGASGDAYESGAFWGSVSGTAFNILGALRRPDGAPGMTTGEVIDDIVEQAYLDVGEFYEPAIGNPGMFSDPAPNAGEYPGFFESLFNYLRW